MTQKKALGVSNQYEERWRGKTGLCKISKCIIIDHLLYKAAKVGKNTRQQSKRDQAFTVSMVNGAASFSVPSATPLKSKIARLPMQK